MIPFIPRFSVQQYQVGCAGVRARTCAYQRVYTYVFVSARLPTACHGKCSASAFISLLPLTVFAES